jgi:hypothetical protein
MGQADMSRKLSNTIDSSIKPSEDRQFIYADGEHNTNRPSWRFSGIFFVMP